MENRKRNFVLDYALAQFKLLHFYPEIKSVKSNTIGVLVCTFYAFCWVFNVLGAFVGFKGLDSIEQAMISLSSAHQLLFKSIFMFLTKRKLVKVIEGVHHLQSLNLHETSKAFQDKIAKIEAKFYFYFKVYKRIILITSYIFAFKPLLSSKRHLPLRWYIPCDIEQDVCYIVWYSLESAYIFFAQYTLASVDSLFFAIIFALYIDIMRLKDYFENLYMQVEVLNKIRYKIFCTSIDCHNKILEVLEDVNSLFQYQHLNQFVTLIVTICFGIYYLNTSYPPHLELIPYLLVYHNQLFMYCFAGEMIQIQVSSIGSAIYNSGWYRFRNQSFIRCLKLIIQRSHKPIRMNIGRIWRLNMTTFIWVLRTSLSFHTFLQTINNK